MNEFYYYQAYIKSVYDGDSVTADIKLGLGGVILNNAKIRLLNVYAPEVRGDEKTKGIIARDYLRKLVNNRQIVFLSHKDKTDKYGRYLGTLYLKEQNINKLMNVFINNQLQYL